MLRLARECPASPGALGGSGKGRRRSPAAQPGFDTEKAHRTIPTVAAGTAESGWAQNPGVLDSARRLIVTRFPPAGDPTPKVCTACISANAE